MELRLTKDRIRQYQEYLIESEKSRLTIEKYIRDVTKLYDFLGEDKKMTGSSLQNFKQYLVCRYAAVSVNSILAAVNGLLKFFGLDQSCLKPLKIQKQIFCQEEKELTKKEYIRLLQAAGKKNETLSLILQTICATGIRVSELRYITVAGVVSGKIQVNCKNKCRVIFIPDKLRQLLKSYIKQQNLKQGSIFINRQGNPIHRSKIWSDMKGLCESANVIEKKVFPHNLRHLFARCYYEQNKDIVKLSDILGHSSIETTRIYTIGSGREHAEKINRMGLVLLI